MDITTIFGLVGALVIVFVTIKIEGGNPLSYINAAAALTAIGGSFMALCLGYPLEVIKKLPAGLKKLAKQESTDVGPTVLQLVEMCTVVRREGLLALDTMVKTIDDPFLAKGAQYIVDGLEPDTTRAILQADLSAKRQRHTQVRSMFEFLGNVAPGYALVGTLLGLVAMLADLDPAEVGHKMSLALLCTFYGCGLSNAFFIPAASKLKVKSDAELFRYKLVIEGLLGIQAGENPRNLEDKLNAYLPNSQRGAAQDGGGSAAREAA